MSAARKKGKWIGGCPPLGYDVAPGGGKLVVNTMEVDQVRDIFDLYLEERSLLRCVELLNGRGWRTKAWTTKEGRQRQGSRWEKASLRKMLTNPVYLGKVSYRGVTYAGEHPGIVDPEAFGRVAEMLGEGRADRRRSGNKHGFLLRGLVRCVACGSAMTSSTSAPRGKPYRYYCCTSPRRRGSGECPVRAVSAAELERFVVDSRWGSDSTSAQLSELCRVAGSESRSHLPRVKLATGTLVRRRRGSRGPEERSRLRCCSSVLSDSPRSLPARVLNRCPPVPPQDTPRCPPVARFVCEQAENATRQRRIGATARSSGHKVPLAQGTKRGSCVKRQPSDVLLSKKSGSPSWVRTGDPLVNSWVPIGPTTAVQIPKNLPRGA